VASDANGRAHRRLCGLGIPEEAARASAELLGTPETGRCILALYRSAAQPRKAEWGEELARAERRPALAIIATEDPFVGGEVLARRMAAR
jgi:hypothetical protein